MSDMSRTAITVALIAWLASAGVQVASPQQDQTAALLAKAQTVVDLMAAGDSAKARTGSTP